MKIVIDCNRVIAALAKESTTREILMDAAFEFFAPNYLKTEIEKYKDEVLQKSGLTKEEFEIVFSLILERIMILQQNEYEKISSELKNEMHDPKDIPYLAACLSIQAEGIWTHDPHFLSQQKCRIFTNIDLLRFSGRAEAGE